MKSSSERSEGSSTELPAGTVLDDRYQLQRKLGEGGMGVVYQAVHTWTERVVAMKILPTAHSHDQQKAARFLREARIASRLAHPHVVQVLDMGREPSRGLLFIVYELLTGEDLRELMERAGALPVREAIEVIAPVLDALDAVHRAGIVHRDVKPENVFLARSPTGDVVPKLIDFGVAWDEALTDLRVTRAGVALGTPNYMAPEQASGEPDVDARADLWAAGVLLFELLAGRLPFHAENYNQAIARILTAPLPTLHSLRPAISRSLSDVVARALQRDRTHRYQRANELLEAVLHADGVHEQPWARELALRHLREGAEPSSISGAYPAPARGAVPKVVVPQAPTLVRPSCVRFGFVPTTRLLLDRGVQHRFADALAVRTEPVVCDDYSALVRAALRGEVDVAWFPPAAYAYAARIGALVPLRTISRAGRTDYVAALIIPTDSAIREPRELRGKRAAWVDPWSAAGYLMPRRALRTKGLEPDELLGSQKFAGSYSNVLEALHTGDADVGASHCALDANGQLADAGWSGGDAVRVLLLSEAIPGDLLCATSPSALDAARGWIAALDALIAERTGRGLFRSFFGADSLAIAHEARYAGLAQAVEDEEKRGL